MNCKGSSEGDSRVLMCLMMSLLKHLMMMGVCARVRVRVNLVFMGNIHANWRAGRTWYGRIF